MTPLERLEYQRRNRRVLYAVAAGVIVAVAALSMLQGALQ